MYQAAAAGLRAAGTITARVVTDMRQGRQIRGRRSKWLNGVDGIDFVRCRICGDHRRVISARHLSKHDIDRETYMKEYELSPDDFIAKDFRRIQSSCRGYYPYGKRDWIAAIKKLCKTEGNIFAGRLQREHRHLYLQALGFSATGTRLYEQRDSIQNQRDSAGPGISTLWSRRFAPYEKRFAEKGRSD